MVHSSRLLSPISDSSCEYAESRGHRAQRQERKTEQKRGAPTRNATAWQPLPHATRAVAAMVAAPAPHVAPATTRHAPCSMQQRAIYSWVRVLLKALHVYLLEIYPFSFYL